MFVKYGFYSREKHKSEMGKCSEEYLGQKEGSVQLRTLHKKSLVTPSGYLVGTPWALKSQRRRRAGLLAGDRIKSSALQSTGIEFKSYPGAPSPG
jgi:hypothetical protein